MNNENHQVSATTVLFKRGHEETRNPWIPARAVTMLGTSADGITPWSETGSPLASTDSGPFNALQHRCAEERLSGFEHGHHPAWYIGP